MNPIDVSKVSNVRCTTTTPVSQIGTFALEHSLPSNFVDQFNKALRRIRIVLHSMMYWPLPFALSVPVAVHLAILAGATENNLDLQFNEAALHYVKRLTAGFPYNPTFDELLPFASRRYEEVTLLMTRW